MVRGALLDRAYAGHGHSPETLGVAAGRAWRQGRPNGAGTRAGLNGEGGREGGALTDGAGLADSARDALLDPPAGVAGELGVGVVQRVELVHRCHQPDRALLDQVLQVEPAVGVPLGDAHHQAQVRVDHRLLGLLQAAQLRVEDACELLLVVRRRLHAQRLPRHVAEADGARPLAVRRLTLVQHLQVFADLGPALQLLHIHREAQLLLPRQERVLPNALKVPPAAAKERRAVSDGRKAKQKGLIIKKGLGRDEVMNQQRVRPRKPDGGDGCEILGLGWC